MDSVVIKTAHTKYGDISVYRPQKFIDNFIGSIEKGTFEAEVTQEIESGKYDLFVDVGASFGLHSIVASHHCKEVYAFEPHPIRYGLLRWNLANRNNIHILEGGIGESTARLSAPDTLISMVTTRVPGEKFFDEPMQLLEFESVIGLFEHPLIKIDTEGNEWDVLNSAKSLLELDTVTWITEFHPWSGNFKEFKEKYFSEFKSKSLIQRGTGKGQIWKFWKE